MVMVSFKCPTCHIDIISPIQGADEIYAFASNLPVLMRCWVCEAPALVVHRANSCGLAPEGRSRKLLDMCLRAAALCRRRAVESQNRDPQDFFLRMERDWLARARGHDLSQEAVVARSVRLGITSEPRQIA